MTQDELFSEITKLLAEIKKDQTTLDEKKTRLRLLTQTWAKTDVAVPLSASKALAGRDARKVPRAKPRTVNVSATVLALVAKTPGLTAPQIMDKLGLREHEAAVRSALKKSKRVVVSDKKWFPYGQVEPQKEKAPGMPEPLRSATALGYE